ncbi:hypothetical protein ACFOM8_01860 [Paracoccus angustae]|uniref:Chemotaxis protein n=1 Tax=Paracoccus angustae TaxID=1671480 RepID=A0ABV7TZF8_9RHOB
MLIGGLLGFAGVQRVRKGKPAAGEDVLEVAGAIVSSKDVERIVQSLDAFTAAAKLMTHSIDKDVDAKQSLTKALTLNSAASDRLVESKNDNLSVIRANTQAANAVANQAHDLRDVIGDLAKELEIQSRMQGRKE